MCLGNDLAISRPTVVVVLVVVVVVVVVVVAEIKDIGLHKQDKVKTLLFVYVTVTDLHFILDTSLLVSQTADLLSSNSLVYNHHRFTAMSSNNLLLPNCYACCCLHCSLAVLCGGWLNG